MRSMSSRSLLPSKYEIILDEKHDQSHDDCDGCYHSHDDLDGSTDHVLIIFSATVSGHEAQPNGQA